MPKVINRAPRPVAGPVGDTDRATAKLRFYKRRKLAMFRNHEVEDPDLARVNPRNPQPVIGGTHRG